MIYLDNAATSWPKPAQVLESVTAFYKGLAANAGRSGYAASVESARMVFDVREGFAKLLGIQDSKNLVFTKGTTEGVNLVLKGFLKEGDVVAVSPMEHNAVVRPLTSLIEKRGVKVSLLPAKQMGAVDWSAAREMGFDEAPKLIVIAHASNVNGVVQDIVAARDAFPDSALLADAAQTAGVLEISVEETGIDFLACSAHKGLLGPTGLGLCYINPKLDVEPLLEGGTGSMSEDTVQPMYRPDRYEAGTMNLHAIAGLRGSLDYLLSDGLGGGRKRRLAGVLIDGLARISRVKLFSPDDGSALLVSFNIEGISPDTVCRILEEKYGILCRPGLHCAPYAHCHLGTLPQGTVRLAPGWANTEEEMETAVMAIGVIAARTKQ